MNTIAEPEITFHGCPEKMSDQILNCSDILKYGRTLFHFKMTSM